MKTIKSSKTPKKKLVFKKVIFAWDIRHFFALRATHKKRFKRPKEAHKIYPKNSKKPRKDPQN